MTSLQWRKIDELLDSLIEMPKPERAAFLDRECGGDLALRRELESLLAAHDQASGFFDSLPESIADDLIRDRQVAAMAGRVFGHYQLTREIGRGGMGVVYEAIRADDQFQQKVAIKLLWPGMNQSEIARRFRRERQILANLDHPHIARLLDGGATEEGWPYFVMEFIAGQPITDYCNEHKLSINQRLTLFLDVCSAVQYAHQNLVVHRDLKPGNILVTASTEKESGTVKLLDFGIAKLLDPARLAITAQPTTNALMMTPEYASPEQMRGEQVSTASDVYSLGVVLYELLTGHPPYDFKDRSLPEIVRIVCEQEPIQPSRRANSAKLRGDVDGILLTALQKETQRRYRSVEQLQEDIRRHLAGQPILAQTITLRYLAGKFVRRNKFAVTAAAMILLTLLAGIFATSWQARRATEQARLNSRLLYAAQMNLAGQAWDAANVARAMQLVEASIPQDGEEDLRGFEWHYLRRLCNQNLRATLQHPNEVRAVAISPDGSKLATGDDDGTARLWDFTTGSLLATLQGHRLKILSLAFSPDGKTLVTGSEDYLIILWDTASGRQLAKMKGDDDAVLGLKFSPNGKWLAVSGHVGWVNMIKLDDSVLIPLKGHSQGMNALAFSPDSRFIVSGSNNSLVEVWKVPINYLPGITRRCERSWWPMKINQEGLLNPFWQIDNCHNSKALPVASRDLALLKGHRDQIYSVAFSPDGKVLASAGADQFVRLWEAATWRSIGSLDGHSGTLRSVVFSPDGKTLASGSDDRLVKFWDLATRQELGTIRGHGGKILSLAYSPDGSSLATASDDRTVKLWNIADSAPFTDLTGHTNEVNSAVFSPDGKVVASGSDDKAVKLWDATTGRELNTLTGSNGIVQSVAYSPDGKRLAGAIRNGSIIVWDAASGQKTLSIQASQDHSIAVAFSPDGRTLATGGSDDARVTGEPIYGAKLWDATSGKQLSTFVGHASRILAVAFSPDGKSLATSSSDRMVKLWNVETGQEVAAFNGHQGDVWALAFSPDGRTLASGSNDRAIMLWDVSARRELARLEAHSGSIQKVAFSPDGRRLASASYDDTVKLWDVITRQELITLRGHQDNVLSVAFSPDGQTLASASSDHTVHLWRSATRRVMMVGKQGTTSER